MAEGALQASWVVEPADVRAATWALPGSWLALLRWPVAFFVAYVGVGLADPRVGAPFAFGSAAVIVAGWLIVALARLGTAHRQQARLPLEERTMTLTCSGDRLRLAAASGHAVEYPLTDLTHARPGAAGLLLHLGGTIVFVPRRALAADEPAWRALTERVPRRRWPDRLGFTLAVWALALGVAAFAFFR